ncbi:MAG: LptF/LptG family permease, partial [Fervidobacterium sp.]
MRTLTRYVIKQSLKPFFMGLCGFIVFVSVEWLYQISDYIIRNRVGIDKLLIFVMYNVPYFTFLGIPVGVLFAIFWVISEMYTSREISALLVHGISAKRLVTPFVILAVVLGFFSWLLGDYVVPISNYKSTQILNQYIFQTPESVVKTNMLVELEKDVYFYVKEHNKQKGELYDVVLFRNEEGNEQILTAKKVVKKKDGWFLMDGSMYVVEIESGFLRLDMQFKEMKLDVAGEIEEMLRAYKTTRDKTSRELREQLETYKKLGINTANLLVELHQRYANALGALVIVLLGLPISLLFGLTSRSWSVILTFLIVVLYQGSGAWLSGMGKEGLMDPILATWLPNIIFAAIGFLLYILIDTPIAYRVIEVLSRLFIFIVFSLSFIYITTSTGFSSTIQAKSNEASFSTNSVIFRGEVVLLWDKYKIICEEASATVSDGTVKVLEAYGNVKFYDQDRLYVSKKIRYEFESDKALIVNAKVVYNYDYKGKKVPVYVYGSQIEYDAETSSGIIQSSHLTTCELEEPHYMILSSAVFVLENKYIIAENSFLVVLGV